MTDVRAIVVTGPESTGKTTLAARLAATLGTMWSPEFSREYAESHADRALGADDVEPIARGQIAVEDAAARDAASIGRDMVVRDTDLVSTVVYARHYYGACPAWIVDQARARRGVLYLLCAPDVPWIADGVRDRPATREAMLDEFRAVLRELECHVMELRGDWSARSELALSCAKSVREDPEDP